MKKNIAWVDTIRVLASFLVISAHVFLCDAFLLQLSIRNRALDVGIIAMSLFFAISGYLIHSSLERTPNVVTFYKRKLVHIVVPFFVCYIILSIIMSLLALLNFHLADKVPLFQAIYGAKYFSVLLGMFPVDLNITTFLGIEVKWFVGEWFIGTIIWLYLLSPFLDKCAVRFPVMSLMLSIIISYVGYYATFDLSVNGRIHSNWGLFFVRIPEFLFGMILFVHREKILRFRSKLLWLLSMYFGILLGHFILNYPPYGAVFLATHPSSFTATLPMIYLIFNLAEFLNNRFKIFFSLFNSFSGISYVTMLIQHVIIYIFEGALKFEELHSFGKCYILILITWSTIKVSRYLKKISTPIEEKLLKKL